MIILTEVRNWECGILLRIRSKNEAADDQTSETVEEMFSETM